MASDTPTGSPNKRNDAVLSSNQRDSAGGAVKTMLEGVAERRRAKRKRVEVLGWITSRGKGRPCCIVCRNLSYVGAQFTAPVLVAPTEILHMSLQLHPAGGPVECDADVRWARMMDDGYCHFGVSFRSMAENHETRLGQFLQAN